MITIEVKYEALPIIRMARRTKTPIISEGELLYTTETRGLVQKATLPDLDLMNGRMVSIDIMNVVPRRPFLLLIINTRNTPLRLPKHQ